MEKHLKRLPEEIINLLFNLRDLAKQMNYNVFLVGGFVRDLILGVENFDIDIVLEGDGIDFSSTLAKKLNAHLIQHKRFGTATVSLIEDHHIKIDIATARKETYPKPASLPEVSFGSIKDDLARRDFSINAMAIDISKERFGQLVDFFHGKKDLKNKKIRILHGLSFIDDPTRILRAIRFKERYKFKLEKNTQDLLMDAISREMLNKVEKQRLRDELILIFKEKNPTTCILRINNFCGLNFIHKNLKLDKITKNLLYEVSKVTAWFNKKFPQKRLLDTWLMYLMILINKLSLKDINWVIDEFAFRKGEKIRIISYKKIIPRLINQLKKKNLVNSKIYKLLEPLSYEAILLILAETKKLIVKKRIADFFTLYNGIHLSVGGHELKSLGATPGPHFKKILNKALCAKIDNKLKTKEEEMEFLKAQLLKNDNKYT